MNTTTALFFSLFTLVVIIYSAPVAAYHGPVMFGGGPTISAPIVVPILFGPVRNSSILPQFYFDLTHSDWMNTLQEYTPITKVTIYSGLQVTTKATSISDQDLRNYIQYLIINNVVPHDTNRNFFYPIHISNQTIVKPERTPNNQPSCSTSSSSSWGAYHSSVTISTSTDTGNIKFQYAVIPDCNYNLNTITRLSSHEFAEFLSDPDARSGWKSGDGGEIADLCEDVTGLVGGKWVVQKASPSDLLSNGSKNLNKAFWVTYGLGANAGDVFVGPISIGNLTSNIAYGISVINLEAGGGSNGLMGLAYESISNIHQFTGEKANWFDGLDFNDDQEQISFYLGNEADGDFGEVTFGGSDPTKYKGDVTYVPLNSETYYQMDFTHWTYKVGNITGPLGNSSTVRKGGQDGIVDTGTTLIYLPTGSGTAIANAVGGHFNDTEGGYYIDCALAGKSEPVVQLVYNETTTFNVYPKTYVVPNDDGTCYLGIQPGADTLGSILGDVFIRNVYTIFDKGNRRMGFAQAVHP
ncbi:hypothetical protein HDU76_006549 [Blyttiomyces sp. JEL0837]|nr:hypothetical protein HDU76_006549 [Blyttiomyces sp. JEL0837]